jgi:hypothetical protein
VPSARAGAPAAGALAAGAPAAPDRSFDHGLAKRFHEVRGK